MAITNGYCDLPQLREYMGDTGTVLTAAVAERAIEAASRAIEEYCGGQQWRKFWLDATVKTRRFHTRNLYEAWVPDLGTQTGLVIKTDSAADGTFATTWATTDYVLEPLDADVGLDGAYAWWKIVAVGAYNFVLPGYRRRRPTLQITARFGWSAVPMRVTEACLLLAARLYERRNSVQGVAGFGDFGVVRIGRTDPDVAAMLSTLRRYDLGIA